MLIFDFFVSLVLITCSFILMVYFKLPEDEMFYTAIISIDGRNEE